MQKSEEQYLELEKTNNGKSLEQARLEIKSLKQSQFEFKELKKECLKKDTIINNLNKQIEKLRNNNFKILTQTREEKTEKKIKESKNEQATLKDLNRIISIINMEGKIGMSDLNKTCLIKPTDKFRGALNFLFKNNFIREINDGSKLVIEKV